MIKQRGLVASICFIGSRLFRIQNHMVFKHDLKNIPSVCWPPAIEIISLKKAQDITIKIRQQLLKVPDNQFYLDDICSGNCIGLVVRINGTIAHFGFIMQGSRTLCLLGLQYNAALLGNDYTFPEFRGQGIQARSIAHRLQLAREKGFM